MDGNRRWVLKAPGRRSWLAFWVGLAALAVLWLAPLGSWLHLALTRDLHSHVVLIPFVSAFLIYKGEHPAVVRDPRDRVIGWGLLGAAVLGAGSSWIARPAWNDVDVVALRVALLVVGIWGLAVLCFGSRWVKSAAFPLLFLGFMIPMPGWLEQAAERSLAMASASTAERLFELGGIPVWRQDLLLRVPGVTLEVAQECSGIRSSYVLIITSVLVAHLFLTGTVRRSLLIFAVIPLGILRNASRIYVIGLLCVTRGTDMLDHWIHRKGGPLFFAVSLVPLFLLVWALRWRNAGRPGAGEANEVSQAQGVSSR